MPALMFTRRLLKALGPRTVCALFPLQEVTEDRSVLGGWSANVIMAPRQRYVIFVNVRTLLSIIVLMAPGRELIERFRESLCDELVRLGVSEADADAESRSFERAVLTPNTDRGLLGVLNDYAFHYRYRIETDHRAGEAPDLRKLQAELNHMPHVSRGPTFSDRSVRALFGVDEPRSGSAGADR
ncbi:MAG: hypothetical protein GF331_03255 [Chitinivibrionales bacterium]|nr:hypothetical protein [Chitinivibrionales bacterium]